MQHIITALYRKSLICALTVLLACIEAPLMFAVERSFDGSEVLYVKMKPSNWNWYGNDMNVGKFAYFYNSNDNSKYAWSSELTGSPLSDALQVTVPAGTWTHVILTRNYVKSNPNWDNVIVSDGTKQQSGNIDIVNATHNYIENFERNTTHVFWAQYIFAPSGNPSSGSVDGVTEERINVCAQSKGDIFSLTPLLKDGDRNYNYDASGSHAWYKWNGSSWEPVSGQRIGFNTDGENEWFCNETVTEANDVYYFLWTNNQSYRRLLHLHKVDCSVKSEITSFKYVLSPVNVNDSTYSVEGLVAFTKAAGSLTITCDGKSSPVYSNPQSPLTFTISGLKANSTAVEKKVTLHAAFSDAGSPSLDSIFVVPTIKTGIVEYASSDGAHYSPAKATYLHNESSSNHPITLTPSTLETDSFAWIDTKGEIWASSRTGGSNVYQLTKSYGYDTTIVLYYTEYNDPPKADDNMMDNSGYENLVDYSDSWYESTSEYTYSGKWIEDPYKDVYEYKYDGIAKYSEKDGLWGITTNANRFWKRMAHISPRGENNKYYAVIDGDKDVDKIAWKATSGENENPNLKLQKGTTYMFSFWVANVNNFGEMINKGKKNNAVLQFKIRYKDKATNVWHEQFLGNSINLNDDKYLNNLWHQNSATFTSKHDATDVTISVVDKNNNGMVIGNDFALDDISFRAVSVQSGTIRARERFEVKFVEPVPEVKDVKIVPVTYPACGQDTFSLKVSFSYKTNTPHKRNLKIDISGFDGTVAKAIDTLSNTAGKWETREFVFSTNASANPAVITNSLIRAKAGNMKATVNVSVTDAKSVTRSSGNVESSLVVIPRTPVLTLKEGHGDTTIVCGESTYSVAVITSYTYFHGDFMHVSWDGVELTSYKQAINKRDTSSIDYVNTLTGLTADGKDHTLRVYSDNALDCFETIPVKAPKGNTITKFAVKALEPACDETKYKLQATWAVTKAADGLYDNLIIAKKNADNSLTTLKTIPAERITEGKTDLEDQEYDITPATHPTIVAYLEERGNTCLSPAADYAHPVVPEMTIGTLEIKDTTCNSATYSAKWVVDYVNQRGVMKAWLDGVASDDISIEENGTAHNQAIVKFTGLIADGSTDHELEVKFVKTGDTRNCADKAPKFTAPIRPVFNNAILSKTTPSYGELEYDVTVSADLSNALGRKLCVKSLDLSPELSWDTTLTVDASGSVSHTFKNITTDHGVSHSFRIYFDDLKHCGDKLSYTSPDQREFKTFEVIRTTEVDCDGYYYAVFHIEAAELGGNLVIREGAATPYMDKLAPSERDYLDSVKLVADGLLHTLTATYTSPEKTKSATFTAPAKPTISMHDDGANEPDCKGIVDKQLHVTITNQNPDAYLIVKEKGTPDKEIASVKVEDISTTPYKVTWNYPADGTERQAYAYVSDRPECQTPVVTGEPKFAQKWEYTRYPSVVACDGSYTDTLKFTWSDAIYDLFIDSVDDASNRYICTKPVGTNTIILHGNVATTEHNKDVYRVYFSNYDPEDEDCDSIIRTVVPSASLVPYMDVPLEDVHYSTPECNDTKTDLIFKLKYARQSDNLKLYLNTIEQEYTIVTGSPISASASEQEVTIKIADLTADGKSRSLRVQFIGDNCCDDTYSLPATPFSPHISDTIATVSGVSCDKDTYTLTVTFKADNHQAKAATVKFRGETKTQTSSVGEYSVPFENVTRTYSDKNDDFVEIYFEDAIDDCARHATAHYTEHPKPEIVEIIIDGNQGEIDCEATSYTLKGSIRYVNLNEKPKVWLNNGEAVTLDEVTLQSDDTLSVAITGISVPATGTKDTIHVSAGGWTASCSIEQEFVSIWRPQISEVTVAPSVTYTHCDGTYDVSGIVTYTHGNLQDLVVECYGASGLLKSDTCHTNTIGESGEVTYTLVGLLDIGEKVDTVKAYFVDTGICDASKQTTTYTTPIEIIISSFSAYAQPKNCNDDSFTVKGELTTSTAQSLDIYVKDASGNSVKATHKSGNTYEYTLNGVTVPGANNSLTAYFDGKDACYTKNSDNTFNEPTKPEASVLSVKPQQPDCDVTTCEVEFAISFTYQNGNQVTVWVDDDHKAEQFFTIPADSIGQSTAKTITGTLNGADLLADGSTGHVLHYQFAGDHACGGESTTFDFPNINPTPVFSLDPIGRLCNSDTELLLPFTINPGEVAEATLTLKNSNEEFVIDADNVTSGILSFGLPAQLAAGKYTATVEVLGTLGCKTSDTLPVEFALDSVVFSKWTDVLLVDNIDGSFKSYQWYENNTPIDTGQVLYYEAMNKDSLYYCRIVTTAGDTIYTCDFVFDSIPRSADHPKQPKTNQISVLPNRVVANGAVTVRQSANENLRLILISTTGKRVAQYTQTESTQLINMPSVEGIYMLRIETDSDVQTVKIVVY